MAPNVTETVLHRHAHIRAVDPAAGTITAILTVEAPDLEGDVILADGVAFRTPLPMLRNHDRDQLVGTWDTPERTAVDGRPAWIARGRFGRSRVAEEAHQDVADGHLLGCSIGFMVGEADERRVAPGQTGRTFRKILVIEGSLTPTPACSACRITAKALRAPAPPPLVLDMRTLGTLVRAELEAAVDRAMPTFKIHLKHIAAKITS